VHRTSEDDDSFGCGPGDPPCPVDDGPAFDATFADVHVSDVADATVDGDAGVSDAPADVAAASDDGDADAGGGG
jgi:hypothetical protein